MSKSIFHADYPAFLAELKTRILHARTSAARAVNRELILLYWDIGRGIVEKQQTAGWGDSVVERLAADLRIEFPDMRGFSIANIWRMRQFYETCSSDGFIAQAVREMVASIPWGHHVFLLGRLNDPATLLYYLRATAQFGWSRSVLLNQIKAGAYERAVKERELEDRLVGRLQQFILELGYGFCFVGRQYRLALGRKEYFVDLLFYHRFLKALVAFDLKIGSFEPEHAGKMDFYLNLLNEKEKAPDDRLSIGIILCAAKDDVEVEFALKSKANPIGEAEYQLQAKLPGEFKGQLPTAKQLAAVVREIMPLRK